MRSGRRTLTSYRKVKSIHLRKLPKKQVLTDSSSSNFKKEVLMAMTTEVQLLGYVTWLRRIDVSEKSAVFSWILTFQFDVSIKICLRQSPKSVVYAVAISPIPSVAHTHNKIKEGCINFPKIYEPPQNSRCQKRDTHQV